MKKEDDGTHPLLKVLAANKEISRNRKKENQLAEYAEQFRVVFKAIKQLCTEEKKP